MKILRNTLVAALAVAANAAVVQTASAQTVSGPYIGAELGWDHTGKRHATLGTAPATIKFRDGLALGIFGGYRFQSGFRAELELSRRKADLKSVNGAPVGGNQKDFSVMGNLLYDFVTDSRFTPYIGAGIGYTRLTWSSVSQLAPPGIPIFRGGNGKVTWQGIVGAAYSVDPNTQVTLDFRYKGSQPHAFNGSVPGTSVTGYRARTSTLMLGVRYTFGSAEEKVAAAAPPPPPPPPQRAAAPPPPPAAEQKFLVFFDFDRANLRPDAVKIVSQAAETAKKTGKARITATGHADTSGTPAYNLALSERRANAVQAELGRLGFSKNEIVVRFKGESEPLVQTGDGVKEPQNRRVEIVLE